MLADGISAVRTNGTETSACPDSFKGQLLGNIQSLSVYADIFDMSRDPANRDPPSFSKIIPLQRAMGDNGATAILNVRFGSLADIPTVSGHVRFTPESGHVQCN
jgi:hypothetical protein